MLFKRDRNKVRRGVSLRNRRERCYSKEQGDGCDEEWLKKHYHDDQQDYDDDALPGPVQRSGLTNWKWLQGPAPEPSCYWWEKGSMDDVEWEVEYVNKVYEKIADHFSATRYKPWPVVLRFFSDFVHEGKVGLDIGCGNGKNMLIPPLNVQMVGLDICKKFADICIERNLEVVQGTMTSLPFSSDSFDFAISIASIHHLRNGERRNRAAKEMVRILKPKGYGLVFVWAFEQPASSSLYRHSLVYLDGEGKQDVLVPWTTKEEEGKDQHTSHRYYHLFKEGELADLFRSNADGISIIESGYDRDNWFIIFQKH